MQNFYLKRSLVGLLIILIAITIVIFASSKNTQVIEIDSFDSCVAAGYPIMDSYPEQCKTPDGRNFSREIGNELEHIETLLVSNPRPNQVVTTPLIVSGQARGIWFFEATFEVEMLDDLDNSLGVGYVTATEEWMTEDFVPFTGELQFSLPSTETGTLVIRNANPSGLPEHQKELRMPVRFQ